MNSNTCDNLNTRKKEKKMRFNEYIDARRIKTNVFADKSGLNRQTVWRLYKRTHLNLTLDIAGMVVENTHGMVTWDDLYKDQVEAKAARAKQRQKQAQQQESEKSEPESKYGDHSL